MPESLLFAYLIRRAAGQISKMSSSFFHLCVALYLLLTQESSYLVEIAIYMSRLGSVPLMIATELRLID